MNNRFAVAVFFFDIDITRPMQRFFAVKMKRRITKTSIDAVFYPNQALFAFIAAFVDQKEGVAIELELVDVLLNSLVVSGWFFFLNTSTFALVNGVLKTSTLRSSAGTQSACKREREALQVGAFLLVTILRPISTP